MVALTGIEPDGGQFRPVQLSPSGCGFITVGIPGWCGRPPRTADVTTQSQRSRGAPRSIRSSMSCSNATRGRTVTSIAIPARIATGTFCSYSSRAISKGCPSPSTNTGLFSRKRTSAWILPFRHFCTLSARSQAVCSSCTSGSLWRSGMVPLWPPGRFESTPKGHPAENREPYAAASGSISRAVDRFWHVSRRHRDPAR